MRGKPEIKNLPEGLLHHMLVRIRFMRRVATIHIPYAPPRVRRRLNRDIRTYNASRNTMVGITNQKVAMTSCWVVCRPASDQVKRNARVVIIGAAASMPPYRGSTCSASVVTPTTIAPPRTNFREV